MRVSIVTEGFSNTGYGHITRCTSIYQAFLDREIQPALYINGDLLSPDLLNGLTYRIIDWLRNPDELIAEIQHSDVLIIDSYLANTDLYSLLSSNAKLTAYLDDNMRIDYPRGIVINGTINSEFFPYNRNPDQTYLLGTAYTPLRKEFRDVPKKNVSRTIQTLLITFGGQDPRNLTKPVLELTEQNFPDVKKNVIIGAGFESPEQYQHYNRESVTFYNSPNPATIRDLMCESDVAISAAGQTLYELAACGTPTVGIAVVDNQQNNMMEWVRNSFIQTPIFSEDADCLFKIQSALTSLKHYSVRKKMSETGQSFVDGSGAKRIVNILCETINPEFTLTIRPFAKEDILCLFQLANDPIVRSNSIQTGSILWKDHAEWFEKKMNDKNCVLFVFHQDNDFIGQVRFDLSQDIATVSISIASPFRGKGLARKMLTLASMELFQREKAVRNIFAYIRVENSASIKSFLASGYVFAEESLINNEKYLKYKLEKGQYEF